MVETGQPASMARAEREVTWLAFAQQYAVVKWPRLAPNSRRNTARALTAATLALITTDRGRPDDEQLRHALPGWAFDVGKRKGRTPSDETRRALAWSERNTRPISDLGKPTVARAVLDAVALTISGKAAAPSTVQRMRGVVVNAAEYAVERRLLNRNPITSLAWKVPRTVQTIDRRVVINPDQARELLDAVAVQKPSGARLVAFFGAMYYSALRPAEAATLRKSTSPCRRTGGENSFWNPRHRPPVPRGPTADAAVRNAS